MLVPEKYIKAIELTQLVSLDLILIDRDFRVLVGKRKNNPAKGYWFVPGSRLYKNQTWQDQLKRVSLDEVGHELTVTQSTLIGVYDHMYNSNFGNYKDENGNIISTHYVSIGLQFAFDPKNLNEEIFKGQHSEIRWMKLDELLENPEVHENTKKFFLPLNCNNLK